MTKAKTIIYWISTLWLSLGMVSTGIVQFLKTKDGQGGVDSITHLGYPVYILTILSIWKFLGIIAVLVPGFSILKEWAYAGFFFVMTGAVFSHVAKGDSIAEIFPAMLLLVLTVVSWYLRPPGRKIASQNY